MKSVIVTGSFGFLGQYISREFLSKGWCVIGVDRRRTEPDIFPHLKLNEHHILDIGSDQFKSLIDKHKPGLIIHAAGSASVPDSIKNPATDFKDSVQLLFNVLDAVRSVSPETRIIFLSSAAVYGNPDEIPVLETTALHPISPYGFHKIMCEYLIEEFFRFYNIQGCSLRVFSAYGSGLKKQVMWDICQKAMNDRTVVLYGTGNETRDFIHAKDLAKCIHIIAEKGSFNADIYPVANGVEVSIQELAQRLVHALGGNSLVRFNGIIRLGDPLRWKADNSRIRTLGYSPTISLQKGLEDYTQWIKQEPKSKS